MFADSDTCTAHSDRASNKSISISAALVSQIDLHFGVAIEENIKLGSTSPVGMITLKFLPMPIPKSFRDRMFDATWCIILILKVSKM